MRCDSEGRFPNCKGKAVVMYPCGEATSFHCYPCHIAIEALPSDDGATAKVMHGERNRYLLQQAAHRARRVIFYGGS